MYWIREVDGHDDEIADTLTELHGLTFFDSAPVPKFDHGHWWLVRHEADPVAFAGVIPSTHACNAGYFCRVGVLRRHCGRGLQLRLMRALEARSRLNGWRSIVSDTTDNLPSANNFIRAGYRLYQPPIPWAWPNTLYWRKPIG
jgi:hypothetical protein